MNEVSRSDPAMQVAEIRAIIESADIETPTCELTLLAIRRIVFPPPADAVVPAAGGWPNLHSSDWQDTGSGPGYAIDSRVQKCTGCGATVIGHRTCGDPSRPECAKGRHQPWCTEHLTADPADPLTEGSDECVTTVRAVEPGGTWRAGLEVMAAQAPDGEDDLTVTLEGDQGRAMTLLEAERLHAALGQLIAVARRA